MNVKENYTCSEFDELYRNKIISDFTLTYVKTKQFSKVSPVQQAVIPIFIKEKKDVAVEACTGSGKTLAFLIPCIEIIYEKIKKQTTKVKPNEYCALNIAALILAPTRELALQIDEVLREYLCCVNNSLAKTSIQILSLVLIGGHNVSHNLTLIDSLKSQKSCGNPVIIIATPGRFSYLLNTLDLKTGLNFSNLEVLIFDEADKLLLNNKTFEIQLSQILQVLPKQRRTGLFSATLLPSIAKIIKVGMRNPMLIRIQVYSKSEESVANPASKNLNPSVNESNSNILKHSIPSTLANYYMITHRLTKFAFLLKFLLKTVIPSKYNEYVGKKCIIFLGTCDFTSYMGLVFNLIQKANSVLIPKQFKICCLHRKLSQKKRLAECNAFANTSSKDGSILLATDIASRGLDFQNIEWIIQYDAPTDPHVFVHRIGRTARAGQSGSSLFLLSPEEDASIPFFSNRNVHFINLVDNESLFQTVMNLELDSLNCIQSDLMEKAIQQIPYSESEYQDQMTSNDTYILPYKDFVVAWKLCRSIIVYDKSVLLRASAAFVSFIRSYKEHHLNFIFIFSELKIGELANSMGLLRIPRVKEILGKNIEYFKNSDIPPSQISFIDSHQEQKWNDFQAKKNKLKSSDIKLKVKGIKSNLTKMKKMKRTRTTQEKAKRKREKDYSTALYLEEKLHKKFKLGKISKNEYDTRLYGTVNIRNMHNLLFI